MATKKALTPAESEAAMNYLAGVFDSSMGFRSVTTTGAICISHTRDWPDYLVATYKVGETREFTSKRGNTIWGWFIDSLEDKITLLDWIIEGNYYHIAPEETIREIRAKFQKTIDRKAK